MIKYCISIIVVLITNLFGATRGCGQAVLNARDRMTAIKSIVQRWELDSTSKRGVFLLTSYKPIYVTAGRWSDNPNEQPVSENPAYSSTDRIEYNNYEAKFQLSFKTKVLQSIFWGSGDLWWPIRKGRTGRSITHESQDHSEN